MILTFILNLFYVFINFVTGLLPNASSLPSAISSAFNYIFGFLWNFDNLVSVSLLFTLVGLFIAFEAAVLLFDMVVWVIHLIRGK